MRSTPPKLILGAVLAVVLSGALFAGLGCKSSNPDVPSQPVDQTEQRPLSTQGQDGEPPGGSLPEVPDPGQNQGGAPSVPPTFLTPSPLPNPTAVDYVAPPPSRVDLGLISDVSTVASGQQFDLTVTVDAGPDHPVAAVQVYLNFDATILQAFDITPGTLLPIELQSQIDNGLGHANYAAGTSEAAVDSPFQLATIRFTTLASTGPGGTTIGFAPLENPRWTKSAAAGLDNAGSLGSITIVVE